MIESFTTYYLIDGVKVASHGTMQRLVLAGGTAIEVSAESQQVAADERKRRAKENAIKDEEIRRAAAEREHAASPEGQRETAKRNALTNPGGIVSRSQNPAFNELDQYAPDATNRFK